MNSKVLIIAEAGVNHNGDIGLAKKLIEVAAEAGADLVKFQTFNAERQVTRSTEKAEYQKLGDGGDESHFDMLRRLELSREDHIELIQYCGRRSIGFLSTGFDIDSVDMLLDLGLELLKVPSGEITNLPYLRRIGEQGMKVLLSTGMATMDEIEGALKILTASGTSLDRITVLHCTSAYPAPIEDVNLRAMHSIKSRFGVAVGYSDHTAGIEVAIASVALGAAVVEKHFTLDREMAGPDHKASLEPLELKAMIKGIRKIEIALGDGEKRLTPSEADIKPIARKSLVASCSIKAGEVFSEENVSAKRPGLGISPMKWDEIIGCVSKRDYLEDEFIEL